MADNRNTFMVVPPNVEQPGELYRFLTRLIEKLDEAYGVRATSPFITAETLASETAKVVSVLGTSIETTPISLQAQIDSLASIVSALELPVLEAQLDAFQINITTLQNNLNQQAIANSSLTPITVSPTYVQSEVQAIANQIQTLESTVNSILNRLRLSNIVQS